ncbi:unnamed protein product [Bursaphelenchus xylophilus]|uniref:(pine wood nematode) hypothetical protein n=1 Tax=Bursaphelenchus xylophilus TaxID=6326 RepID=A0A1I7SH00_BURXY|nr:unnamed protein product [Bursaphelenchus xylophilus]CAG9121924.1 unnamed protein product [Bursaphelenchus xylophilus]
MLMSSEIKICRQKRCKRILECIIGYWRLRTELTDPIMAFDAMDKTNFVVCGKLHLKPAARIVSLCLLCFVFVDIVFSFGRNTAAMFYSWMTACFSIGIYGALVYAVFKEKRMFMLPYLIFQTVFIGFLTLLLLVFTIGAMFSNELMRKLSRDIGAIDEAAGQEEQAKEYRAFVIFFFVFLTLFLSCQAYFLSIIYRFFIFLRERETSFNFNVDNDFQLSE